MQRIGVRQSLSKLFTIQVVTWASHQRQLKQVRQQVFIEEQNVPVVLELDDLDADAIHLLVEDDSSLAIACARLLDNGSIGRMAVIKTCRGHGIGMAMLGKAVKLHQQLGRKIITLSAQIHAIGFYEKAGFVVVSAPYLDANILHVDMQYIVAKH